MKDILAEAENRLRIPYSVNRFQGKYQEIVPQQYKSKKRKLQNEKKEQEKKKKIMEERNIKVKAEDEKVRKANMLQLHKKLPLQQNLFFKRKDIPKKSNKEKKKTIIINTTEKKKDIDLCSQKNENNQRTNEQINNLIQEQELLIQRKSPLTPEDKQKRKELVEKQKEKARIENEEKKIKKDKIFKERITRLKQVMVKQKEILLKKTNNVVLKKKKKKKAAASRCNKNKILSDKKSIGKKKKKILIPFIEKQGAVANEKAKNVKW